MTQKKYTNTYKGLSIDEYDFAPFQSEKLTAVDGVETFQYSHNNDIVAGNISEKGPVHYMETSTDKDDGHPIGDYLQYIHSLPEGHYVFRNGQFIKTE